MLAKSSACPSPQIVATIINVSSAAVDLHAAMFKVILLPLGALVSAFPNRAGGYCSLQLHTGVSCEKLAACCFEKHCDPF